ncbi:hypothetical protein [Noviherbaspirillum saxi]|uniref:Uncharacterized protein n=1 Tax=Noviherbaspirillum saxi TaxID=2320863 RepID=A0A3A3FT12_9BURK|nr:hypothetical protein [Noviherbaspirillum saxi]RJF99322.1 hypothetical protein D3871_12925 [Noviherbaspirillum saxi]
MLFLKSTAVPVAPGVFTVDVAAKPPGKTFMIYIAVDAANPPTDFIGAVEGMGFKQVLTKPYTHHDGKKIMDIHFQKAGTDIFEGWTDAEKNANLALMQEVLGKFDVSFTPRVMSLAEAYR